MDAEQILSLVRESDLLQKTFRGVFRRDGLLFLGENIPSGSYILNSTDTLPGEHWLAMSKTSAELPLCVFFDSMGRPPSFYGITIAGHSIVYNERQVQPAGTATCALYCLYFLHQKCMGANMAEILGSFHNDRTQNEDFVEDFARLLASGSLQ